MKKRDKKKIILISGVVLGILIILIIATAFIKFPGTAIGNETGSEQSLLDKFVDFVTPSGDSGGGSSSGGSSGGGTTNPDDFNDEGWEKDSEDNKDEQNEVENCSPELEDPCGGQCNEFEECVVSDVGVVPGTVYLCTCEIDEEEIKDAQCDFSDTDGNDVQTKGYCDDKKVKPNEDYCENELVLAEYLLGDGDDCFDGCYKVLFYCPGLGPNFGCEDGKCVELDCEGICANEDFTKSITVETESECNQYGNQETVQFTYSSGCCCYEDSCNDVCDKYSFEKYTFSENEMECNQYGDTTPGITDYGYYGQCCCYDQTCPFTDSDPDENGNTWNVLEAGTCIDDKGEYDDYCSDATHIKEYYLNAGEEGCLQGCKVTPSAWDCALEGSGWVCDDGACVDPNTKCKDYCTGLSRSSYIGGACFDYNPHGALSKEMVCTNNNGIYKSGGEGTCTSGKICCCR